MNPKNKVALVTGSGKRIGKHIAISLAKTGSKVIIHYNESEEEALKTTEIINSNGGSAYPIKANLESSNEIFMMVDSIKKKYGNLDIIINNASKFKTSYLCRLDIKG